MDSTVSDFIYGLYSILFNVRVNLGFMSCSLFTFLLAPVAILFLAYLINLGKGVTISIGSSRSSSSSYSSKNKKSKGNHQEIDKDM